VAAVVLLLLLLLLLLLVLRRRQRRGGGGGAGSGGAKGVERRTGTGVDGCRRPKGRNKCTHCAELVD